jgi:hypothetical protein
MKSDISQQTILSAGEMENTFLGAVTENYVARLPFRNITGMTTLLAS